MAKFLQCMTFKIKVHFCMTFKVQWRLSDDTRIRSVKSDRYKNFLPDTVVFLVHSLEQWTANWVIKLTKEGRHLFYCEFIYTYRKHDLRQCVRTKRTKYQYMCERRKVVSCVAFSGTLLFPYKAEPCKENIIVLKETLSTRQRKENFHDGERKTGENQICGHWLGWGLILAFQ